MYNGILSRESTQSTRALTHSAAGGRRSLGREGLVILALRKLNRQPSCVRLCTVTTPLAALGKLLTEFVTLYRAPPLLLVVYQ